MVGATVRTLDPDRPIARAVAVRGDRIVALDDDAVAMRSSTTEVVDLAGATVTPGLVDGHLHALFGVTAFAGADLSGCRDLDDLRTALAGALPGKDGWVTGFGLDHNVFGGAPITNQVLEEALPGAPLVIVLYDGHSSLASDEALRRAGVTGPRRFEQRAEIVCDTAGRPTGLLLEHAAMETVRGVVPPMEHAELHKRLLEVMDGMATTGLTGGVMMDAEGDALDVLAAVEDAADLPIRLRVMPWCMPEDDLAAIDALQGRHGRSWAVGGVKFFIDGTVEGGTAWLGHADCHGQGADAFWRDPAAYTRAVRHFAADRVQTATHAIGDAGVRHVVESLAGVDTGGVRHRVEHLETLPLADVRRVVGAGLVASMQPSHTGYARADGTDEWSTRLGRERAARAWPCRDVRDAGGTLVLGSDWPIASYDAREVLAFAQLRRRPGTVDAPITPDQALTGLMALEGMTTHAALADGTERTSGRVAVGHRADLTAFAVDPVVAPADELAAAPVRLTVSSGRITHRTDSR
ncbi:amidohydrolase family protein [Nocardioides sp. KC13]|uniref:Amidohydrolase family protein n=2 Tax=Nocardioides turkmenicus TaxID=2711220 RepID=A0A6M1RCM0_9ACTN|nr:amidohydrolase family protein [Nocardioides sp. KC13]NGN95289.1 amidohydrolase family protein [Nocardioides sp. KC13]